MIARPELGPTPAFRRLSIRHPVDIGPETARLVRQAPGSLAYGQNTVCSGGGAASGLPVSRFGEGTQFQHVPQKGHPPSWFAGQHVKAPLH